MCAKPATSNPRPLTEKQRVFCREYVIDFNAKAAAERAGYSAKTAQQIGSASLQRPAVQDEIKRLTKATAARAEQRAAASQDEIVARLTDIMRADIRDVLVWGTEQRTVKQGDGNDTEVTLEVPFVRVRSSEELPPHVAVAVTEVSLTDKGTFRVKMADKHAAIDKLMRHLGLYEADNRQKTDPLAELIAAAQGSALPIATRQSPQEAARGADDE